MSVVNSPNWSLSEHRQGFDSQKRGHLVAIRRRKVLDVSKRLWLLILALLIWINLFFVLEKLA